MSAMRWKNPGSPAEWQLAVNMAYGALCLDSARQYGLVTGGPAINLRRCDFVLRVGRARGYEPAADAVDQFIKDTLASAKGQPTERTAAGAQP